MTDPQDGLGSVDERRAALTGGSGGIRRRVASGIVGILLVGAAPVVLFPEKVTSFLGWGTSDVEEMQRTSNADLGLSTSITRPADPGGLDVEGAVEPRFEPTVEAPIPQAGEPVLTIDPSRLDDLEAMLGELLDREQPAGIDADELDRVLKGQETRLKKNFDREQALMQRQHKAELAAARAAGTSRGATDEELARQRLKEIRDKQLASDANVLDETGGPGSGQNDDTGGDVRELNSNESFLRSAAQASVVTAHATLIEQPSRTIVQGSVIQAALETAINTELPGLIRAVVSQDVWSYDGANILMPRGTRLIGTYSSDIALAQSRVLIAWTRAITPDSRSVMLGSVGADALGRSGQTGEVDSRFMERFGSAALISLIGAAPGLGAEALGADDDNDYLSDVARDSKLASAGVTGAYLRLPPIIKIEQGTRMTVFVNRDLVL